jgi:DNA invertase Pin-like site-specific DNA recombinase
MKELERLDAGFVSLTEALDLTTPAGRATLLFAEFERQTPVERVQAGLTHVQQNGRRLGRPATAALFVIVHDGNSKSRKMRRR